MVPVVLDASGPLDGLRHVLRSAVVRGDDQCPVAEDVVEVLQVAGGGITGLDGVATLVDEAGHLQSVLLAGGQHELPQPGCSHAAGGAGVQGTLDDGQVLQFQRHLVGLEGFFEQGKVEVRGTEHDADGAAQASAVLVDELAHDVVVGHVNDVGQTAQAGDVDLLVEDGILVVGLAVLVEGEVVLRVPLVEQTVQFVGHHALGQANLFVLSETVVVDGYLVLCLGCEGQHQQHSYGEYLLHVKCRY